jgi:hypothetical protein
MQGGAPILRTGTRDRVRRTLGTPQRMPERTNAADGASFSSLPCRYFTSQPCSSKSFRPRSSSALMKALSSAGDM